MAISPYIAGIRKRVGSDLLLLPAVAALPIDESGRVLLVRQTDTGRWATIGGTVEVDESPAEAAVREAAEEAGIVVELVRLLTAVGGPDYRAVYPNGDQVAYVGIVYQARVVSGQPMPDGDETFEVDWFHQEELVGLDVNDLNRHLLDVALPIIAGR